jgi:hypothetical protein
MLIAVGHSLEHPGSWEAENNLVLIGNPAGDTDNSVVGVVTGENSSAEADSFAAVHNFEANMLG